MSERLCVCGCGREVRLHFEASQRLAIELIPELLAWDRHRAELRAGLEVPGSPVTLERLDDFLAEGGEHYRGAIAAVHGENAFAAISRRPAAWLRYSRRARRKLAKIAPGAIVADRAPALGEEDLSRLDRQQPDRSWTGAG